jgi:hypothetical protein
MNDKSVKCCKCLCYDCIYSGDPDCYTGTSKPCWGCFLDNGLVRITTECSRHSTSINITAAQFKKFIEVRNKGIVDIKSSATRLICSISSKEQDYIIDNYDELYKTFKDRGEI